MPNHQNVEQAIAQKRVTDAFARRMEGASKAACSGSGDVIIENINNS